MRRPDTDTVQTDCRHAAVEQELQRRDTGSRPARPFLEQERIENVVPTLRHRHIELIPVRSKEHDVIRLQFTVLLLPAGDVFGQNLWADATFALTGELGDVDNR